MNRNKIGSFIITNSLIEDESSHEILMKLMGRMIIVRAEQIFARDGIEYTAISDYFDELENGDHAKRYIFEISKDQIKAVPASEWKYE